MAYAPSFDAFLLVGRRGKLAVDFPLLVPSDDPHPVAVEKEPGDGLAVPAGVDLEVAGVGAGQVEGLALAGPVVGDLDEGLVVLSERVHGLCSFLRWGLRRVVWGAGLSDRVHQLDDGLGRG